MPASSATTSSSEEEHNKGFMKYSYMFVRLYSRLSTGQHLVSGTIDRTGSKLLLQVIDRDCNVCEGTYTDAEVTKFKNGCNEALTWPNFFDLLQRTFAEHLIDYEPDTRELKLTVKHDRQSDSLPIAPFVTHIAVTLEAVPQSKMPDFPKQMTDSMTSFVMLRTGDRKEMDRVVDVIRVDAALKDEVERVQDEVKYIEAANARLKLYNSEYDKNYQELADELNAIGEDVSGWEKVVSNCHTQESTTVCRIPDPLSGRSFGGGYQGKLDKDLLSVLKSELPQATYTYAHLYRYNNVAGPVSPDEKDNMINKLKPQAQQLYRFLVDHVMEWEFNVFEFHEKAVGLGGNALVYLGYFLLWRHNLPAIFNLDETKLLQWLEMVSTGYVSPEQTDTTVTFHTCVHAADVLHAVHYMLVSSDGIKRLRLKDHHLLSAFMAAMMHDFGHQGVNNTYHSKTQSDVALVYSDSSILEHFHMGQVFELMKLPQYDLFECTALETKEAVERAISEMILATDMKRHGFYMAAYEAKQGELDHRHSQDILMTLCMILKAADISNCAKELWMYQKWAGGIMKEYSHQSELEKSNGLEETQSMMHLKSSEEERAKGQLGFMNHVVLPLYALMCEAVPDLRGAAGEYLAANKVFWADQVHKAKGSLD